MTVESAASVLVEVEGLYSQAEQQLLPLMRKNGPLSSSKLAALKSQVTGLARRGAAIQLSDSLFTGICRYALAMSKGNLVIARSILHGPNGSRHLGLVQEVTEKAKDTLRSLLSTLSSVRLVRDWTGTESAIRLNGLGCGPPCVVAAGVAATVLFIIFAGTIAYLFMHAFNSEEATRLANEACERDAQTGNPCSGTDWQGYRDEAIAQQNEISPPLINPDSNPLGALSDLVFWGGMAAVLAGLGYVAFVTYPASKRFRDRFDENLLGG